ncbi:hypothetical protein PoB_003809700 [Plakobranchus ocellatus]|uniref:Uncharacterized protein n=1 Tax=Plakobranchus ocellatus TaxID=259542 RepID=A0AAV4AX10_9GAST|nr:hypothetical protein PoB_003809700 [Plakobranchus ocellatus]
MEVMALEERKGGRSENWVGGIEWGEGQQMSYRGYSLIPPGCVQSKNDRKEEKEREEEPSRSVNSPERYTRCGDLAQVEVTQEEANWTMQVVFMEATNGIKYGHLDLTMTLAE